MLTTAAGTIRPASVLVIGAGVAGLQAIATAKRLGAVVEAYDVRGATKDQVKSLGAKFVETGVFAEGTGGYARELTAEEELKQQEVLDARIAAEQGGNCELTRAGETVLHAGVKILGPVNLPASLPYHASEMYSRNLFNLPGSPGHRRPSKHPLMAYSQKIIVVPGYGLAVAQAQHKVWELAQLLIDHAVKVRFAIHPVAGRMPGCRQPADSSCQGGRVSSDRSRTSHLPGAGAARRAGSFRACSLRATRPDIS